MEKNSHPETALAIYKWLLKRGRYWGDTGQFWAGESPTRHQKNTIGFKVRV